jgi:hypothetical protein
MRTLIATVMINSKDTGIYCTAKKVSDRDIDQIKNMSESSLKAIGFTIFPLLSLEQPGLKGKAIFYEGRLEDMRQALATGLPL